MTETVQRGCAQDVVPNFEALKGLPEDCDKEHIRDQEIMKNREILSRQNERHAQRTKRSVQDQLSRRWARHTTVDNTCRVLSLFNLHF